MDAGNHGGPPPGSAAAPLGPPSSVPQQHLSSHVMPPHSSPYPPPDAMRLVSRHHHHGGPPTSLPSLMSMPSQAGGPPPSSQYASSHEVAAPASSQHEPQLRSEEGQGFNDTPPSSQSAPESSLPKDAGVEANETTNADVESTTISTQTMINNNDVPVKTIMPTGDDNNGAEAAGPIKVEESNAIDLSVNSKENEATTTADNDDGSKGNNIESSLMQKVEEQSATASTAIKEGKSSEPSPRPATPTKNEQAEGVNAPPTPPQPSCKSESGGNFSKKRDAEEVIAVGDKEDTEQQQDDTSNKKHKV